MSSKMANNQVPMKRAWINEEDKMLVEALLDLHDMQNMVSNQSSINTMEKKH